MWAIYARVSSARQRGILRRPVRHQSGRGILGKTQRRRLNRGGDRQTNAALYRIILSRLRWAGPSQDYLQRRLVEGKTKREIIRCLKRYVAREIYRHIAPANTAAHPTGPARDAA